MRVAGGVNPIDRAIRAIPVEWFRPDRRVYWTDMLASAAVGWAGFAGAVVTSGWARAAALIVAVFGLYRAALFIHELTHLALRDVPALRATWNALVGVPLLLPSFLYEGVHTDHHRPQVYGTVGDPEYVPFGRRSPLLIAAYFAGSLLVPIALAVRFAVLAPLSWAVPPVRPFIVRRLSALAINHDYVRRAPLDGAGTIEEAASAAAVWAALVLWRAELVPAAFFGVWLVVAAAASVVNAVRTLAAHRYDHDDGQEELSMLAQLLDSCTIAPQPGLGGRIGALGRALWAPVGLRYHALHHWIPSLPYHNLGRVHRLLGRSLGPASAYAATEHAGFTPAVVDLVRRASQRRR